MISWEDFEKIDIRVGTIIEVSDFKEARKPAYKLLIDFGDDLGNKKSSAQIKDLYSIEDLINKQVICVVNLPPKQVGPFISECLVTGLILESGKVVLVSPEVKVPNGLKLS